MNWSKENNILVIDPGPVTSGVLKFDFSEYADTGFYKLGDFDSAIDNWKLLKMMLGRSGFVIGCGYCVIEDIVSYGGVVGNTTLNTAKWVGRFDIGWRTTGRGTPYIISRNDVKIILCGARTVVNDNGARVAVSDAMIKEAVHHKFEPYGGGSDPYKGIKAKKGPLYGTKTHVNAALALAVAAHEIIEDENRKKVQG